LPSQIKVCGRKLWVNSWGSFIMKYLIFIVEIIVPN
jgi:hypothetical protein